MHKYVFCSIKKYTKTLDVAQKKGNKMGALRKQRSCIY